jgi:lambda repressor-like predicted transcriptional regulator
LLRAEGDEHAMAQIAAELRSSGWTLIELRRPSGFLGDSLATVGDRFRARAVLRARADRMSIDVWAAPDHGGDASIEETIAADNPELARQTLALSVTEALRARGLRVEPRREVPVVEPPPVVQEPPASAAQRDRGPSGAPRYGDTSGAWLELAPALGLSPGGLPAELSLYASVSLRAHPRWSVSLLGTAPATGQTLSGEEGTATVRTVLLGAAADYYVVAAPNWEAGLRAGVSSAVTMLNGEARPGYTSGEETEIAAAGLGGASLHYKLSRRFRLVSRTQLGWTFQKLSVRFGNREVAVWGQPFVLLTLGVEASAFGSD